ncbi:hypothetical protein [Emticicia sp. CRIBPO]|nr:hypothetical protein [Emticicia sp. CRIBPO]
MEQNNKITPVLSKEENVLKEWVSPEMQTMEVAAASWLLDPLS